MTSLNETLLKNMFSELQLAIASNNKERIKWLEEHIELVKADIRLREEMGVKV